MMGFGGFLKQMAETNRLNREMLKGGRKKKFDRQSLDTSYRKGELFFTTKKSDPNAIKMIRASLDDQNKRERVRTIFKMILSLIITAALIAFVLDLTKMYWSAK